MQYTQCSGMISDSFGAVKIKDWGHIESYVVTDVSEKVSHKSARFYKPERHKIPRIL